MCFMKCVKGISLSIFTFAQLIQPICTVNEVDFATSLLRDMTKHGFVPNSSSCQTLIHALTKYEGALV